MTTVDTTVWTTDADERLREYLTRDGYSIPTGLGTENAASSIAAINLALTGELVEEIPDCMSEVVGRWIFHIQNGMPESMRDSREWRELLPLAAATGRDREEERLDIVDDWFCTTVVPLAEAMDDTVGLVPDGEELCVDCCREAALSAVFAADPFASVMFVASYPAVTAESAACDLTWRRCDPIGVLTRLVQ